MLQTENMENWSEKGEFKDRYEFIGKYQTGGTNGKMIDHDRFITEMFEFNNKCKWPKCSC